MGCFNTKGWFSHLQMSSGEEAFGLICIATSPRPHDMDKYSEEILYRPTGRLYPIAFPIFGEYDSYGRIENIKRDENVNRIESFFGVSIETIVDVLDDVTTIFRCHHESAATNEKLALYESFRDKLGLNDNYYLTGETGFQIVMTYDYAAVYGIVAQKFFKDVQQGLIRSRMNFFKEGEVKDKWASVYKAMYDDSKLHSWEINEIPCLLGHNDYGNIAGFLYNGYGEWYHILEMYQNRVQLDKEGKHISVMSKDYDYYKQQKNLIDLLYDESLDYQLVMFVSFMIFLQKASMQIEYSFTTGQDDINDKILEVYKEIGNTIKA